MIFVGSDWARTKHDALIMDEHGAILLQIAISHSAEGLNDLAHTISDIEPEPAQVHVGIELHDGALLRCLLDQGYTVYAINPKSAERARDRLPPVSVHRHSPHAPPCTSRLSCHHRATHAGSRPPFAHPPLSTNALAHLLVADAGQKVVSGLGAS